MKHAFNGFNGGHGAGRNADRTFGPKDFKKILRDERTYPAHAFNEKSTQSRNKYAHPKNGILGYFGFRYNEEASLLKSLNGGNLPDDIVRLAYNMASLYGLKGNNLETPQETKDIFATIASSIHKNGVQNTYVLINSFGLESMPIIVQRDSSPLELGDKVCLVPRRDLEDITARLANLPAGFPLNAKSLENLGYTLSEANGLPFYVSR